jgi:hypothetical protein
MSDSYGFQFLKEDGSVALGSSAYGGVLLQIATFSGVDGNVTDRRTYAEYPGRTIAAIPFSGGYHNITSGVDGNGYPYVQAPGSGGPPAWLGNANTDVAVFLK